MAICAAAATGIPELGSAAAAGLFHVPRLDFPEKPYTHSNIAFSPIYPENPPERSGLFPSGLLGPVVIQSVTLGGTQ
jgi:hypothetical protein